jgi:hypothetical protein
MHSKEIHQEWYQETFEVISVEPIEGKEER